MNTKCGLQNKSALLISGGTYYYKIIPRFKRKGFPINIHWYVVSYVFLVLDIANDFSTMSSNPHSPLAVYLQLYQCRK